MAYDLEFLPVDSGNKSGDAIVMRWSQGDTFKIGVIDGGTKESGELIVKHINEHYGSNAEIEFVLNTHPDSDHCSGLTVVLDNFKVKTLWMHKPWDYSSELLRFIEDDRVTDDSLEKRIKERLSRAYELYKLALSKKIQVFEPFQGNLVGPFTVLSPSKDYYKELVLNFRNMPASSKATFAENLFKKAGNVIDNFIEETFDVETLKENGETSAENESSTVLYANLDNRCKVLLTGDVGIQGLIRACDYADMNIRDWNKTLDVIQIPHHGSRRNVSPTVLDRILGAKTQIQDRGWAFCCASKDSETHPRKSVLNAFTRRGYKCTVTKGGTKRKHYETHHRNWTAIEPLPFYNEVEK